MSRVTILKDTYASEVKRFYLPGFEETSACPKCGEKSTFDGNSEYIGYPVYNAWKDIDFCCGGCDHEWVVKIRIRLTVEVKG